MSEAWEADQQSIRRLKALEAQVLADGAAEGEATAASHLIGLARADAEDARREWEAARREAEAASRATAEAQACARCVLNDLAEQETRLAAAHADVRRAEEERNITSAQALRGAEAASEQLQCATREAANQLRDAELLESSS